MFKTAKKHNKRHKPKYVSKNCKEIKTKYPAYIQKVSNLFFTQTVLPNIKRFLKTSSRFTSFL